MNQSDINDTIYGVVACVCKLSPFDMHCVTALNCLLTLWKSSKQQGGGVTWNS